MEAAAVASSERVPRAGARDFFWGLRPYFRPRTHRSPLRKLGDRCFVDLPGIPKMLMTCSPDDAKVILADRERALSLGQLLERVSAHPVLFGTDSLVFLEGDAHANERRKVAPPFHGELLRSYERAMSEIAAEHIAAWPTGRPVRFHELAQEFVLDVMRSIVFGVTTPERKQRLDRATSDYCRIAEGDAFMTLGVLEVALTGRWRRYPPLERAEAAVDEVVLDELAARREGRTEGGDDCLTLFLELNAADPEPKSDETLARDLRGLLLAGYETTAISLAWTAEMLVHHPHVLRRLEHRIDDGDDTYLDAVINEVLRLRPVFPFTGRRALRDLDLGSTQVRRGTLLVISLIALHERSDLYPEPLAFRPDRFLDTRPGTYTWLPFGGGVHRCIGAAFAQFEARVLFRTLLQERTLHQVTDRGERARPTHPMLVPGDGARVRLERRAG